MSVLFRCDCPARETEVGKDVILTAGDKQCDRLLDTAVALLIPSSLGLEGDHG